MKLRKVLISFLASFFLLTFSQAAFANTESHFKDVESGHENFEAISYLYDEGVVQGYTDGEYKSENRINRAEFVKIVVETLDYDTTGNTNCFPDVKTEWYAPYICTAEEKGIIDGYSDNYFRPSNYINFAEASKVVANAFLLSLDSSNNENWYHEYVAALEMLNAIPMTIDSFDKEITRGDMAEMIWRINTETTNKESYTYHEVKEVAATKVSELNLSNEGNGKVRWTHEGDARKGFKVVWSKTSGPTYPTRTTDQYQYLSSPDASSATLTAFDGTGTYYVRVCEYTGSGCDLYSNEVTTFFEESTSASGDVTSITLTSEGEGEISWELDGYSDMGFKVVYSLSSGPTYPTRSGDKYQYFSSPNTSEASLDAFDGAGTYYVRVCEYLGGACGLYSNEITVALGESDGYE